MDRSYKEKPGTMDNNDKILVWRACWVIQYAVYQISGRLSG